MHPTVACYAFHLTRKARHAGNHTNYACSLSLSFVLLTSDATNAVSPCFSSADCPAGLVRRADILGIPVCREIACD